MDYNRIESKLVLSIVLDNISNMAESASVYRFGKGPNNQEAAASGNCGHAN